MLGLGLVDALVDVCEELGDRLNAELDEVQQARILDVEHAVRQVAAEGQVVLHQIVLEGIGRGVGDGMNGLHVAHDALPVVAPLDRLRAAVLAEAAAVGQAEDRAHAGILYVHPRREEPRSLHRLAGAEGQQAGLHDVHVVIFHGIVEHGALELVHVGMIRAEQTLHVLDECCR